MIVPQNRHFVLTGVSVTCLQVRGYAYVFRLSQAFRLY